MGLAISLLCMPKEKRTLPAVLKIFLALAIIKVIIGVVNIIEYGVLHGSPLQLALGIVGVIEGGVGIALYLKPIKPLHIVVTFLLVSRLALYVATVVLTIEIAEIRHDQVTLIVTIVVFVVYVILSALQLYALVLLWNLLTRPDYYTATVQTGAVDIEKQKQPSQTKVGDVHQ